MLGPELRGGLLRAYRGLIWSGWVQEPREDSISEKHRRRRRESWGLAAMEALLAGAVGSAAPHASGAGSCLEWPVL